MSGLKSEAEVAVALETTCRLALNRGVEFGVERDRE